MIHKGKKPEDGTYELYNIQLDPYETNDVSKDNMVKVQELKKEIQHQLTLDNTSMANSVK